MLKNGEIIMINFWNDTIILVSVLYITQDKGLKTWKNHYCVAECM